MGYRVPTIWQLSVSYFSKLHIMFFSLHTSADYISRK